MSTVRSTNSFNHTQFTGLDTTGRFDATGRQVNAGFGQYTGSADGRWMGLKLYFGPPRETIRR